MQEVFEKIIEKLEELKKCGTKHYEDGEYIYTSPDYDHETLNKTIKIVKQEAEQYNESLMVELLDAKQNCGEDSDCSDCIFGKTADRCFLQELQIEERNNGWIPCSERLPEGGKTYLVTNAESFGQYHTYKGWYDGEHKIWHMEGNFERKMNVIAWQPLPQPYKPKGE